MLLQFYWMYLHYDFVVHFNDETKIPNFYLHSV